MRIRGSREWTIEKTDIGAHRFRYLPEAYPDPDEEGLLKKRDYLMARTPVTEIYDEPAFDYVMIKTTEGVLRERGGSLYLATNRFWRAGARIADYSYVVSVVDQVVQRVYRVDTWFRFADGRYEGRWGFFAKEAEGDEVRAMLGKRIPECYRMPGNANPVLYKR